VNTPGIVSFAPGEQRTAMRAIFKAGGFSKFAKKKTVRIIHYGKNKERTEKKLNAAKIMDEGILDEDVDLTPGDMIIVPQSTITL
jgi:protein involved in polysaccharide export with SLBB domain